MQDTILKHKKGFMILAFAMLVFGGCFTFPILNITRLDLHSIIPWYNIFIACILYYEIGQIFRVIYENKKVTPVIFSSLGMTLGGMVCRYFLEFGEISNTYNFSVQNVIFHTVVAILITTLTAWTGAKKK